MEVAQVPRSYVYRFDPEQGTIFVYVEGVLGLHMVKLHGLRSGSPTPSTMKRSRYVIASARCVVNFSRTWNTTHEDSHMPSVELRAATWNAVIPPGVERLGHSTHLPLRRGQQPTTTTARAGVLARIAAANDGFTDSPSSTSGPTRSTRLPRDAPARIRPWSENTATAGPSDVACGSNARCCLRMAGHVGGLLLSCRTCARRSQASARALFPVRPAGQRRASLARRRTRLRRFAP
ncbi:hypothetical protein C8Q77DRAFT_244526 [Trametes polyzona]|nr:hypothetical protein C8Q77DRAFT_244526 [Trametes polyzona]